MFGKFLGRRSSMGFLQINLKNCYDVRGKVNISPVKGIAMMAVAKVMPIAATVSCSTLMVVMV